MYVVYQLIYSTLFKDTGGTTALRENLGYINYEENY